MDFDDDYEPTPAEVYEFHKRCFRDGMLHEIGPHVDAVFDIRRSGHKGPRIPPGYNLDPWLNRNLVEAILTCVSPTEA